MAGPGFDADYSVMNTAKAKLEDAKSSLAPHLDNFQENANLDDAIPSISGQATPLVPNGPLGPDIDKLETLIAQNIKGVYQDAVDSVEALLVESTKSLERLDTGISESLAEYRDRDEGGASELPDIDSPR